ncbi:MAG: CHASE domain-containing protein [Lacunisphaera sp.]
MGLTLIGAYHAAESARTEARLQFERLADRLSVELQRRMRQPVYGLNGARGVYAASQSVERAEFRAYVESRDLPREFPGVLGFGFIRRVPRADLPPSSRRSGPTARPILPCVRLGTQPTFM